MFTEDARTESFDRCDCSELSELLSSKADTESTGSFVVILPRCMEHGLETIHLLGNTPYRLRQVE